MRKKIWVKLFTNENKYYCYDVGTNNIMAIDKTLYFVLKKYNYSNKKETIENLKSRFNKKDIIKAIDMIDKFKKESNGFILEKRIKLKFPFTRDEYEKLLSNLVNHMILNITEKCNFRCKYCKFSENYEYARFHTKKSMEWCTIKKAIDFFVKNASYFLKNKDRELVLGFYGGEPVLEYENIFNAINYLETNYSDIFNRFRFSLTTNGSLFNVENIKKFIKYDFSLLVSLDGPGEIHDRYRVFPNNNGTYDLIKKNLELIRRIDEDYFMKKVGFSIVLAPEFDLERVYNYFKSVEFSENRVYMFSEVNSNDTTFLEQFNMNEEWKKAKNQERFLKKKYLSNRISNIRDVLLMNLFEGSVYDIQSRIPYNMPNEIYPNGICLPGLQKIFVDTYGNFHLCEKINWNFSIGNVDEGFDTEKIFKLISEYINTTNNCKNCWAIRFCKDCYLSSLKENTFSRERKKEYCKRRRRTILVGLKDYVYIMERNQNAFKETNHEPNILYEAYKFLNRI